MTYDNKVYGIYPLTPPTTSSTLLPTRKNMVVEPFITITASAISGNLHAAKVYVHEFGHLFLGLGDEYVEVGSSYNDMYPTNVEPWEANLTTLTNFNKKWKDMLDKDTPVPTTYDPQNPKKPRSL